MAPTIAMGVRITGEDAGGAPFGQVGSVAISSDGLIHVVDELAREVRVFDPKGAPVRTYGGPGEGPGEFGRIGPAVIGTDGRVWVENLRTRRLEVFDPDGAWLESQPAPSAYMGGGQRTWTTDGRLIMMDLAAAGSERPVLIVHRLDDRGRLARVGPAIGLPEFEPPTLIEVTTPDGRYSESLFPPFGTIPQAVFDVHGSVWTTMGEVEGYALRRQDLATGDVSVIQRNAGRARIPARVREDAWRELRSQLGSGIPESRVPLSVVPEHYPALDQFAISADGLLWVLRSVDDDRRVLEVFDSDGRYLGRPRLDVDLRGVRLIEIRDPAIYAVHSDSLGVQTVLRLDMVAPARGEAVNAR